MIRIEPLRRTPEFLTESLHASLRKVTKNRGAFPSEEAAFKLLYLALRNASKKWSTLQFWREAMRQFERGDFIIVARGRRYYTNDTLITKLAELTRPAASISLGATPAASIYVLDAATIAALKQLP